MAHSFTREQFHDLVWTKPLTHLAKEFGLSDVALHKVCKKHAIPTPPVGWWAKKAAGKPVRVTPLPPAPKNSGHPIIIADRELRNEPRGIAAVREAARIRAWSAPTDGTASHPLVVRTITSLRKAQADYTGLVRGEPQAGLVNCEVALASLDRLETILRRIVAAAGQQGFDLKAGPQFAAFSGPEEDVEFSVRETYRRMKHEPTDKERAAEAKWDRLREHYNNRPWDLDWSKRPKVDEWDWIPTGQLAVELEHVWSRDSISPRRKFADGRVQRLEGLASDIAVGLAVTAAVKHSSRLRREEEAGQAEEAQRMRELAKRAAHIEERRSAALAAILGDVSELENLQRLMTDLQAAISDTPDTRVAEFFAWGGKHLAERKAALSGSGLAALFERQRLFGTDDDYLFRPSTRY